MKGTLGETSDKFDTEIKCNLEVWEIKEQLLSKKKLF